MKEFYYTNLEEYLKKADAYDNPKQLKMFEVNRTNIPEMKDMIAVTYIRTALFGWRARVAEEKVEEIVSQLRAHDHARGVMLEVGKLG